MIKIIRKYKSKGDDSRNMEKNKFLNVSNIRYYIKGLQNPPIYTYTEKESSEFEKFIKDNFGEYTNVYHELYSPDIHFDAYIIPPNKEHKYYTLVTKGMGAYKMNVPFQLKDYELERAELVIYLPSDWNFDLSKKENGWVITLLKHFARLPIEEKSWVGCGHTLSHNDTESYASNTKLSSAILLNAIDDKGNIINFRLPNKEKINFYYVFPLYKEELEYQMEYGTEKLFEKIGNVSLVLDINRKNYCADFNKNTDADMEGGK